MKRPADLLKQSEARARDLRIGTGPTPPLARRAGTTDRGLEVLLTAPPGEMTAAILGRGRPRTRAAISKRAAHLTFAGARPSDREFEHFLDGNDLVDQFFLERALVAAKPVCRLVVRNQGGREVAYATGFMIGPEIL